jgi:hypothetical protein
VRTPCGGKAPAPGYRHATPTPELRKAIERLDIRLYSPYRPMSEPLEIP